MAGCTGHKKVQGVYVRFNIWDNKTDDVIAVGVTSEEACKILGIKPDSFRHCVHRMKKGILRKYYIERYFADEEDDDDCD